MIILKNNKFVLVFLTLMIASCSVSRKIEKELIASADKETFFKGISVLNAETGESIVQFNEERLFTPASNVKLFSLYTAWRTLPDSLVSFEYLRTRDSLILRGTANPLFLVDSIGENSLGFLTSSEQNIYLVDADIDDSPYGPGWAWDDYHYAYMPEKNRFPVYGNVVSVSKTDRGIEVIPELFLDRVHMENADQMARERDENEFYVDTVSEFSEKNIPFKTSNQLVADLLSSAIDRKVILVPDPKRNDFNVYKHSAIDTLYSDMMINSDNFKAEQLMLRVGHVAAGRYSVKAAIEFSLNNYLKDMYPRPRWVDGSGLSRYNLFSPSNMTFLLKKMFDEFPHEQLFSYLPQGGISGTLKDHFKGQSYIYAKSGTLSNNYALSGYLITKKGTVLIFSYMNNHFSGSSAARKKEMSAFFDKLYHSY